MIEPLRVVLVADAFVTEHMMKKAVDAIPNARIISSLFWGEEDRKAMRNAVRAIETGGPYALDPPASLCGCMENCDVLMVHLCPVPVSVLEKAPNLKVIASTRGGLENIDVEAATVRGVAVLSNPAHNANAVAEMTIGLILAETRNICRSAIALSAHNIWREQYPNSGQIHELSASTVGIVGFGTIGRLVAMKLKSFGCRILVADPYVSNQDVRDAGCELMHLEELLGVSDIVTLHMRVTPQTVGIINSQAIARMKPTACLVNTARAALVDMDALYAALQSNRIRGAALDVFPIEPIDRTYPLLELDNVTLTNHRGGDTVESYSDSPSMVLKQALRYLDGQPPRFWANAPVEKSCLIHDKPCVTKLSSHPI